MKFLITLIFILPNIGYTQELSTEELSRKVDGRLYPGGVDEEDLTIQQNLKAPVRYVSIKKIRSEVYKEILKESENEGETP